MNDSPELATELLSPDYTRTGADSPSDWVTDDAYHAGRVKRYHTWPVLHPQTVGEHCWQVALVYEQIFGPPMVAVERHIRHHDTSELVVGDPPFPVKASNPVLKSEYDALESGALDRLGVRYLDHLLPAEKRRVKIADLLEMMRFGMLEAEMGNRLAIPVIVRTEAVASRMASDVKSVDDQRVQDWIVRQWRRHERIMHRSGANPTVYCYENRGGLL